MTKLGIIADTHLGYRQYGSWKRHAHFGQMWLWAVDTFISHRVDAVIHAGDLFGNRKPDFIALSQAMMGLKKLREYKIPFFIVEGNHERPVANEGVGVLDFLHDEGLLINMKYGVPYRSFDITILGVPYSGLAINEQVSELIKWCNENNKDKSILVAHTGLNFYPKDMFCDPNGLSLDVFEHVEQKFNLFITGHIHRSYQFRNNLNPGSTEVCSIKELEYRNNGILIVELPYGTKPVKVIPSEAYRRFHVYDIDTDKMSQAEIESHISIHSSADKVFVMRLKGSGGIDKAAIKKLAEEMHHTVHFISDIETEYQEMTLNEHSLDREEAELELLTQSSGEKARLYKHLMEAALADELPEDIIEVVKKESSNV